MIFSASAALNAVDLDAEGALSSCSLQNGIGNSMFVKQVSLPGDIGRVRVSSAEAHILPPALARSKQY